MKLLYVTRSVTVHDLRFMRLFVAHGIEVVYAALDAHAPLERLPAGVDAMPGHWRQNARSALRAVAPDVTLAGPLGDAAHLAVTAGCRPLMGVSWGIDVLREAEQDAGVHARIREVLGDADALFCDSSAVQRRAAEIAPAARGEVVCLPWGLEAQDLEDAGRDDGLRRRLGWEDQIVVVSTRAWEPVYRIDTVIEGFAQAWRADARLRLMLVNDGALREPLLASIARAGVGEAVHLAGRLNGRELRAAYAAADIYVSASEVDGTSVSLLEAMAASLTLLVSDIPGNRAWLDGTGCGHYFPVGEAAALARNLASLAASEPAWRASVGDAAARHVRTHARWEDNAVKLLEALQRLSGAPAFRE